MAYKNQNYMTNFTIKENINKNQKQIIDEIKNYSFTSYGDAEGETEWGSGTVQTTGRQNRGLTEVEVITNSSNQSFVGQKFYIISSAQANNTTLYPLYANLDKDKVGIYVKIEEIEEIEEEVQQEQKATYSFISYSDSEGTTETGSGTIEETGVTEGDYTQMEFKTNSNNQSLVGQKFYIASAAKTNNTTIYRIYSDAGTTETDTYMKISTIE